MVYSRMVGNLKKDVNTKFIGRPGRKPLVIIYIYIGLYIFVSRAEHFKVFQGFDFRSESPVQSGKQELQQVLLYIY